MGGCTAWERGAWRGRYPDGGVAPCVFGGGGSGGGVVSGQAGFCLRFSFFRKRTRCCLGCGDGGADGGVGAFKTDAFALARRLPHQPRPSAILTTPDLPSTCRRASAATITVVGLGCCRRVWADASFFVLFLFFPFSLLFSDVLFVLPVLGTHLELAVCFFPHSHALPCFLARAS